MADLITRITLSTGKVVNIPVFYKVPTWTTVQRACGILAVKGFHYDPSQSYWEDVYRPYTDAELLELGNMLSNRTLVNTLQWSDPNPHMSYVFAFIAWVQQADGTFTLRHSFQLNYTNYIGVNTILAGSFNSTGYCYYNNELPANPQNGDSNYPTKLWDESCELVLGGSYPWSQHNPHAALLDIRSGSFYQMKLFYDDTGYIGNTLHGGGTMTAQAVKTAIDNYLTANPDSGASYSEDDGDNPYGLVVSGSGGGDGDNDPSAIDQTDAVEIPDIPQISIANNGFITIYNPTAGQLNALSQYLWSSAFDIDDFKRLFSDPMQCIIGLGIVPVSPTLGGTGTVHFGDVDTHVAMSYLSTQFVQKSMGSVSIEKYVGCFMDYQPYTQIEIYLPYIGTRPLNPDDIMGDTITLTYNIDVLTGGCCAIISSSSKGVLYQFNGSCIANIPVTSINYSSAIQNAISAVSNLAITGIGVITGAAPLSAVGVAGLASNAANAACNSKPTVQRSGQMGGSAGLMSVQTPYLIITRPNMSVPNNLNKFTGNTANITMNLNNCSGFTMIDQIHLDNIPCTDDEKAELMSILQKGVIF